MVVKEFAVKIDIDADFCESDLIEVITDGVTNVGNHRLVSVKACDLNLLKGVDNKLQ